MFKVLWFDNTDQLYHITRESKLLQPTPTNGNILHLESSFLHEYHWRTQSWICVHTLAIICTSTITYNTHSSNFIKRLIKQQTCMFILKLYITHKQLATYLIIVTIPMSVAKTLEIMLWLLLYAITFPSSPAII